MNNNRNTILACIDGSTFSAAVADYAAWISRLVGSPLKLLHNIERQTQPETNLSGNLILGEREELLEELTNLEARRSKILREQGKLMLESAYQRALEFGAVEPQMLQRHGSLVESLIDFEDEIRALVVGVRGEGHVNQPAAIGAQLESIIRAMHRPVLVVNRPFERMPTRLMFAYDGSPAARKGLDMVSMSPLYTGLECHLVFVGKDNDASRAMLKEGETTLREAGLSVSATVLSGDVEESLIAYQNQHGIDLIVMGAFGHSRLRELLFGSRTVNMLSHTQVPLLLLR